MAEIEWFGVRCIFSFDGDAYEERITVWQADNFDKAVSLAEADAEAYADASEGTYLGFAQAYVLPAPPTHGGEVFWLSRTSDLDAEAYLDQFFDTGAEDEATLDEADDVHIAP